MIQPVRQQPPEVTVEVFSWLRGRLGFAEAGQALLPVEVAAGETAGDLLARLAAQVPGFREHVYDPTQGRLYEHVAVLLNGRALELAGGLAAQLRDGDRILLLPGFAGG